MSASKCAFRGMAVEPVVERVDDDISYSEPKWLPSKSVAFVGCGEELHGGVSAKST